MAARDVILYVGGPLPELSQTFVVRELLGLRRRGRKIVVASVRAPDRDALAGDPTVLALADEAHVALSKGARLEFARVVVGRPELFVKLLGDLCRRGIGGFLARVKYMVHGLAGMALGFSLRHDRIGHVHAHLANNSSTVALYAARTLGVPFSFTGHAADLFIYRSGLELKLRRAAFVACISHWHRYFYQGVEPGLTTPLPIVRCSVEVADRPPPFTGSGFVAVGRLVAKKGFDLLIRAYALMRERAEDYDPLCIVGDGPERVMLQRLARDLGVEQKVVFAGAKPHPEVLRIIAQCEIFVLPCRTATSGDRDGIPVVLMEAMAAGKPVIAGDLPTIRELIEAGHSGLLVPPDDSEALAEQMQALMHDRARCAQLGRNGWARIREEFSDDVNLDRLEAAIMHAAQER